MQQKTLLAALAEQCKNENWRKERGRFVPRAANWLADHRWEETPLPPAADEGGTGRAQPAGTGAFADGQ